MEHINKSTVGWEYPRQILFDCLLAKTYFRISKFNFGKSRTEHSKSNAALNKNKILLVEDDKVIQEFNSTYLRRASFNVDIAGNYQEALDLYQDNSYDLILTDVGLPGKSGIDLCRKIRDLEKNTKKTTPILTLTAFGKIIEKECFEAGATGFATKPLMQDELISFVKKWIKKGK